MADAIDSYLQNPDPNSISSAFDELAAYVSTADKTGPAFDNKLANITCDVINNTLPKTTNILAPRTAKAWLYQKLTKSFGNSSSNVPERSTVPCSVKRYLPRQCMPLFKRVKNSQTVSE